MMNPAIENGKQCLGCGHGTTKLQKLNMITIAGLSVLVVIALFSCDSVRRIDMKNQSADTASIIWTLNEDSLSNNPFMLSNSKELKFQLYGPKRNQINMSFGPGGWSPAEVERLANRLTSLEIISATQRIKIDSIPQLRDFLLARRKGVGGARIEIVIPK